MNKLNLCIMNQTQLRNKIVTYLVSYVFPVFRLLASYFESALGLLPSFVWVPSIFFHLLQCHVVYLQPSAGFSSRHRSCVFPGEYICVVSVCASFATFQ